MEWKFTEDHLRRLLKRIAARDARAPNGRPSTPQLQHRNSVQSNKSRSQDHVGKQASNPGPANENTVFGPLTMHSADRTRTGARDRSSSCSAVGPGSVILDPEIKSLIVNHHYQLLTLRAWCGLLHRSGPAGPGVTATLRGGCLVIRASRRRPPRGRVEPAASQHNRIRGALRGSMAITTRLRGIGDACDRVRRPELTPRGVGVGRQL